MNRWLRYTFYLAWALAIIVTQRAIPAGADDSPAVRAVLFYSPTCPHCHQVINNDLPPLMEKYGDRLQIIGVDTTQPGGQALYQAAITQFNIPADRRGVPTLIVGDAVLVGSGEIPQLFPGLIEQYLAEGGVNWPNIPGLAEALAAAQPEPTAETEEPTAGEERSSPLPTPSPEPEGATESAPVATAASTSPVATAAPAAPAATPTVPGASNTPDATPVAAAPGTGLTTIDNQPITGQPDTIGAKVARDPLGNTLAIIVLIGMALMVGYTSTTLWQPTDRPAPAWRQWAIPALCLVGLGVAGYLAYVETSQVAAVCGPVGDCNAVQQSEYARLLGLIPIGVLGLVGYAAILAAWFVGHFGRGGAGQSGLVGPVRAGFPGNFILHLSHFPGTVCYRRHLRLVPDLGSGDDGSAVVSAGSRQTGAFRAVTRGHRGFENLCGLLRPALKGRQPHDKIPLCT